MKLTSNVEVHYELCRTLRESWKAVKVLPSGPVVSFYPLPAINARLMVLALELLAKSTIRIAFFYNKDLFSNI